MSDDGHRGLDDLPDAASVELQDRIAGAEATGPRISLTMIKNCIADVRFEVPGLRMGLADDHPLSRMTLCFITTFSGFVVVGKSAAMSPENFDAEKGETFAYEDALRQLWPLHAFSVLESAWMERKAAEREASAEERD